jgi:hypothetical protein
MSGRLPPSVGFCYFMSFSLEARHDHGQEIQNRQSPHHVGMNSRVIEVLQSLTRVFHNLNVFPGEKPGQSMKNGLKYSD